MGKTILAHMPYTLRCSKRIYYMSLEMMIKMMKFLLHMSLGKKVKIMKILPHMPYALRFSKRICHMRLDALSLYAICAKSWVSLSAYGICAKMYKFVDNSASSWSRPEKSLINFWDVMERDKKPSHATVPLKRWVGEGTETTERRK